MICLKTIFCCYIWAISDVSVLSKAIFNLHGVSKKQVGLNNRWLLYLSNRALNAAWRGEKRRKERRKERERAREWARERAIIVKPTLAQKSGGLSFDASSCGGLFGFFCVIWPRFSAMPMHIAHQSSYAKKRAFEPTCAVTLLKQIGRFTKYRVIPCRWPVNTVSAYLIFHQLLTKMNVNGCRTSYELHWETGTNFF